jgi:hypothetical protein
MNPLVEKESRQENQAGDNDHQRRHRIRGKCQFPLLKSIGLYTNHNSDKNQKQGHRKAKHQVAVDNGFFGDGPCDKKGETHFAAIVEKFGEILANLFSHRRKSYVWACGMSR